MHTIYNAQRIDRRYNGQMVIQLMHFKLQCDFKYKVFEKGIALNYNKQTMHFKHEMIKMLQIFGKNVSGIKRNRVGISRAWPVSGIPKIQLLLVSLANLLLIYWHSNNSK